MRLLGILGNVVPRAGAHFPPPRRVPRFPIGPERRQATAVGGASPPRRRSYWPGRARWEGRFEKKQPAPRGTPRADWLSRGLAPASERATGTGWGQSAAAAALTAGTGRPSFQFPFPLRWIPPRALPTAAASCFSRRRPPPRPPWLRRSFRMSSRLSPISASPWSSWGAGESGRGALRALGAGTPLFLASVVIPPKKARFGGLIPRCFLPY